MESQTYTYIATSQPATAVCQACVGPFTRAGAGDDDWNNDLIIAKGNRLEVHGITSEGLEQVFDVGLYGHISHLALVPHPVSLRSCSTSLRGCRHKFVALSLSAD